MHFGAYNGNNIAISSAAGLNDGVWHLATADHGRVGHAAVRRRRTGRRELERQSRGQHRVVADRLRQPQRLAGNHTTFHFKGNLDNVAVYEDTLPAAAVQEHFAVGR